MDQWINFKQLRSRLRFADVLSHYGVKLASKGGDQIQGFCPLPSHRGERRSPSFSANLVRGIWQCFGCGAKGNVLDFAVRMEGLSPDQSGDVRITALRLAEKFPIGDERRSHGRMPRDGTIRPEQRDRPRREAVPSRFSGAAQAPTPAGPPVRINVPLDFELKGLQPEHPYLRSRGLSTKTIWQFGLGYCPRGLMAGRIAIPLRDTDGRLIGYAGRVVDDSVITEDVPKYKLPAKRERAGIVHEFRKSHFVYNAHAIKKPVDYLVVVEGFPSVWWLHQAGVVNAVALMGWSCSPEQAAIILAKTTDTARIIVFPDGDEGGDRCAQSVFAALGPHRWLRRARLSDGRQPTDCRPDELITLVTL
jgi:DNA primase